MIDKGLRHGPHNPLRDQGRTGNLQKRAARHKLRERYLICANDVKRRRCCKLLAGLLKKISEARRAKIDERRRT
jgi:hypothetical protein